MIFFISVFAVANDGVGGMNAGGLYIDFNSKTNVVMESEVLEISDSEIKVNYIFKNDSDKAEKHLVVFPLPDYDCSNDDGKIIEDFTTVVDGDFAKYKTEIKIVNSKGADITKMVESFYGSVKCRDEELQEAVKEHIKVDVADAKKFKYKKTIKPVTYFSNDKNLLDRYVKAMKLGIFAEFSGETLEFPWGPAWKLRRKYYFYQDFIPNKTVKIMHRYTPSLGTSVSSIDGLLVGVDLKLKIWSDHLDKLTKRYEEKIYTPHSSSLTYLDYILKTANSWNGGIKDFQLKIKRNSKFVYTNYVDGLISNGDYLELSKKNFKPDRDMRVVIVDPVLKNRDCLKAESIDSSNEFKKIEKQYDSLSSSVKAKSLLLKLKSFVDKFDGTPSSCQAYHMINFLAQEYKLTL